MILDKLENSELYSSIHPGISIALTYLRKEDLDGLSLGKHIIQGDEIFAIVMEYETKENKECKTEAHKLYADVQYMVKGKEICGFTTLQDQKPLEDYNQEKDAWFFNDPADHFNFKEGSFAVFFPDDLHQPGIKLNEIEKIKKVVIKVKL